MEFSSKDQYRVFKIPKKTKGKFRTIEAPNEELKEQQRHILRNIKSSFIIAPFVHSFRSNHNVISNAQSHIGLPYVLHIDASNFFPSITYDKFIKKVRNPRLMQAIRDKQCRDEWRQTLERIKPCFCDFGDGLGTRLPQGAPTSPWLSNAFLYGVDCMAAKFCYNREYPWHGAGRRMRYSRYADDITISGDSTRDIYALYYRIQSALKNFGITVNDDKTHLYVPGERHVVCGIVTNVRPQPKRRWRKNLRAALFQERNNAKLTPKTAGRLAYLRMCRDWENRTPTSSDIVLMMIKGQDALEQL